MESVWSAFFVLWAAGAPLDGSAVEPPLAVTEDHGRLREIRPETEVTIDRGTQTWGRVGFGGPLGASASLALFRGLGAEVRDGDDRVKAVCAVPIPHCAGGFLVDLAAGTGGGRVSLGLGGRARIEEEDFRGTVGLDLKVTLARTWGDPVGTEAGLTYLGPELDLSVSRVELSLGVLWRLSGSTGRSVLFAWGLGFGL